LGVEGLRRDLVELGRLDDVQVDGLVLDPERVVEALELRDAHVERHLAALEPGRDGAARPLALGAAAGGLAALARDAPADALLALVRAGGRLQVVDLDGHADSSTETRCGTRASMPRISGRSGRVLTLPMRPRPSARSVPRCLGLAPMADRTWRTVRVLSSAITRPRWAQARDPSGSRRRRS